jgi:ParB-like chromosome segregation protein Spo0J
MTLQGMAKHIELWLLDKLIPYARNPRTHSDAQIAQIAASIAEFGFNSPILVDSKAGIIAGHGRLLAARKLELTEVPVIVLDHLTETQKRAYIIADNQLAVNAGWDADLLRLELAALQEEDFDVSLIGFDDEELARLLAAQDATEGLTDEDAIPALPETAVSATGDLWILDNHKLLVGDATDREQVVRLLAADAADLVFSDLPYNVDYEGYTEDRLKIKNDRMSDADFKRFLEAAFHSFRIALKPRCPLGGSPPEKVDRNPSRKDQRAESLLPEPTYQTPTKLNTKPNAHSPSPTIRKVSFPPLSWPAFTWPTALRAQQIRPAIPKTRSACNIASPSFMKPTCLLAQVTKRLNKFTSLAARMMRSAPGMKPARLRFADAGSIFFACAHREFSVDE